MEAKVIHELEVRLLKSAVFRVPTKSLSYPHRLYFKLLEHKRKSFTERFRGLAERWKLHAKKLSKGQDSTKQFLIHAVQEGETLTSISRMYGVSIKQIAEVNATIVDVDLVFEGQSLNIPFPTCKGYTWKSLLPRCGTQEICQSALNLFGRREDYKIFTVLSSKQLLLAKRTGYLLVLLPLIAFCIKCIMWAFHHRVCTNLKHQAVSESEAYCHRSRTTRWKSALIDMTESDNLNDESRQDSVRVAEDQSQVPFEDLSHDYCKLEPAYQKFLSECGMNKFGYWRGGSPE